MKELYADPDFRARSSARMKELNADPDFRARHRRRWARKAVREAGLPLLKVTVDAAKAYLDAGLGLEGTIDALIQDARGKAHR
jgi:hypothetical protein